MVTKGTLKSRAANATRDESRQAHEPRKQNVRRSLITRTPVSGARDTHGVIFVIASSELTGEPLTRTPVSGARDTRVTTRTCEEMRVTTRTCEEMICVIASSDLTGEPRETRIASQDTDAAPELDEGHRRSMHEKEEGKGREG